MASPSAENQPSDMTRMMEQMMKKLEEMSTRIQALETKPETNTPESENEVVEKDPPATGARNRPRPCFPNPELFHGERSLWRAWKVEMQNKLDLDRESIGDEKRQFAYVFSRLGGTAKKNVTTFVSANRSSPTACPQSLLDRLEVLYGDRNRIRRALKAIGEMKQPPNTPFANWYPKMEQEFADAEADNWPDQNKGNYLLNALNEKMKSALVTVNDADVDTFPKLVRKCEEISGRLEILGQWKTSTSNLRRLPTEEPVSQSTQASREDMMEWEPTPPASTQVHAAHFRSAGNTNGYPSKRPEDRQLLGKRAKWVEKEEIDARRRDGRCLRCGRTGCRIMSCPLAAAVRPSTGIRSSASVVRKAAVEEDVEEEEEEETQ
jgi:hypothetical protein